MFSFPPGLTGPHRVRLPLVVTALLLALFTLLRTLLCFGFSHPNPIPPAELALVFLVGLHVDLVVAVILSFPFALWAGLSSHKSVPPARPGVLFATLLVTAWSLMVFLLVAEGYFFEEFQSRYNPVAIDYLLYPHEVFVNIWQSYPLVQVLLLCLTLGSALAVLTLRSIGQRTPSPRSWRLPITWLLAAGTLVLTVRPVETRFSRDRVANELANNTFRSLLTAILTRNLEYAAFYPTLSRSEAFQVAQRLVVSPTHQKTGPPDSLQRRIPGDPAKPRLNVVLLLEESLGSEFWGCLNPTGPRLTPQLDAIAESETILFDNLYADGNRTIRGYEGVYCSFPPLPGDSVVARDRTTNIETLAQVLRRDGYQSLFVCAGRGSFDGTATFARANGWDRVVELKDYEHPVFTSAWGVCNEDLYDRALTEMRQAHTTGRPFFITTMSVSNHKPYTYPKGRIPEDPAARSRAHVVKYTDFALGRFFNMARKEPFWTNTLFVVVADHGARVYGSQTIPIKSYEIPMLITGPAVVSAPKRISTLGCQLDVAPTILGLIGRPYETTFFGHDLSNDTALPSRVLLHHNRSVGIYANQRMVVFNLNKQIEYFEGDPKLQQMHKVTRPDPAMLELQRDGVALFQVGDELYMNRQYHLAQGAETAAGTDNSPHLP